MTNDPKPPMKTMLGWVPTAQSPNHSQTRVQETVGFEPTMLDLPPQPPQGYALPEQQVYASYPPSYPQHTSDPSHAQQMPQYGYAPQNYAQSYPQYPQYPQPQYPTYAQATTPQPQSRARGSNPPGLRAKANATYPTHGASARLRFIRLTYLHLLGAILTFAGLLYLLMTNETLVTKVSAPLVKFAFGGRGNWGVVLLAFMAISFVADYWASHTKSRGMQYLGLALYVVAEALIFVPLLALVAVKTHAILARGGGDPHIIRDAAYVTLGIFAALTASVFLTRKDFSFLRSGLVMASGAALMLIVMSLVFGFNLGLAFSVGMVLLAAGYILYQTSQVLAHYDPRQHVAASLALFSSVALMFWYVIRIFLRARQ